MFRFKHFAVEDDASTMKVGTDAVLLGCLAPLDVEPMPTRVLDVGTGCGVVALVVAQRLAARLRAEGAGAAEPPRRVDAIDVDAASVGQAAANFAASPWNGILHASRCALQQWQNGSDLIVCNPPFFARSLRSVDPRRNAARHNDTLPYADLATHLQRLLSPHGRATLVVPTDVEPALTPHLHEASLSVLRRVYVHHTEHHRPKRVVLTVVPRPTATEETHLYLFDGDGRPTETYRALVSDFYLWA